ncbi:MAG: sn-glycerol-3-phosphate ABC transporter ATP-binding protein UgpC [Azospirillaceae bacterium]
MATVKLSDVKKAFGSVEIIKGVDLDIHDNEFVVFVGPSGCGKSTLLRLIAGLEDISSGELTIDGKRMNDTPPAERGIAMVFQSYALYPHMTVYENMAFGLKLAKFDKKVIDDKVREAARILQLEHLLQRKPKELSGGQRQRVAIGRSIVRDPKVFLFDEPLSNLDAALRVQMRIEIAKLHSDLDATMIYVTHDQVEAMTLADKIVVLQAGIVVQVGSPLELYYHPQNKFVAGFIGSPKMNFVPVEVAATDGTGVTVTLPGGNTLLVPVDSRGVAPGARLTLGVRPEHMSETGQGDATMPVQCVVVERLGGDTYGYVQSDGVELMTVQTDGTSRMKPGDRLDVGMRGATCHLFGDDDQALPLLERNDLADIGKSGILAGAPGPAPAVH